MQGCCESGFADIKTNIQKIIVADVSPFIQRISS